MSANEKLAAALGEPGRSGVPGVLGAAEQIAAAQAAITDIRELHYKRDDPFVSTVCNECVLAWPCPTVQILERHGL